VAEIKATMQTSVIGTDYEAKYSDAYWILLPTKRRGTEIWWNWLVFDNVDQFFDYLKVSATSFCNTDLLVMKELNWQMTGLQR
jgi:hypothetical protein